MFLTTNQNIRVAFVDNCFSPVFREMRREFILVLLGMISISFFSSLLSSYVQIEIDKILLDTVVGVVGAGNFSYWQLGHSGPLLLELTSLSGDADLYVSDSIRPSYETDKNNFSSVTCGPDLVNIPADFPRPVGIGVFGHWASERSEYSIQVFLDAAAAREDLQHQQEAAADPRAHHGDQVETDKKRGREKSAGRAADDESKPRFLRLLNILDMIFEMFIL